MSGTPAYRPAGQTVALSVASTSHAPVAILANTNDQVNWVGLLNSGTTTVAVNIGVAGAASTFPADGTPGNFVIPASTPYPIVLPLPQPVQLSSGAFQPPLITAIGSVAGPVTIFATPLVMQT